MDSDARLARAELEQTREQIGIAREGIETFNIVAGFVACLFSSQFIQQAQEYWNFPQLICLIVYGAIALVAFFVLAWLHYRERGVNQVERELRKLELGLE